MKGAKEASVLAGRGGVEEALEVREHKTWTCSASPCQNPEDGSQSPSKRNHRMVQHLFESTKHLAVLETHFSTLQNCSRIPSKHSMKAVRNVVETGEICRELIEETGGCSSAAGDEELDPCPSPGCDEFCS